MLLTEVWERMDYMAIEPPTHVLLAMFLGYNKSNSRSTGRTEDTGLQTLLAIPKVVGKAQPAPAWLKNSPSINKMFDEMREKNGGMTDA